VKSRTFEAVGLQHHSEKGVYRFRNIRIREI
jgi:hypothetical protein